MHSSQGKLAAELGTTRSTLHRTLHSFESLDIATMEGSQVALAKPDRLVSYTW